MSARFEASMLYSVFVDYEWNEEKAVGNLEKHGVTFEEAASVFGDPLYIDFYARTVPSTSIDTLSSGTPWLVVC